ncbi:MAG: hypothetical protein WCT40_04805, partial [Candidatus Magasanikbacteria bacterium]
MIIYIYGEDTFRSRQYLKDQVAKFKAARDPQGYNVVILDCAKVEAGKVLSEISASPFLAPKRMIVLENILSNNDKGLLSELVGRVIGVIPAKAGIQVAGSPIRSGMTDKKGFPESNIVVFYQSDALSKVKEAKELDAILKKEKYAKEFEAMSGASLIAWINSEIKNRGGKISASAAQYLAANVGGDMWHLNTLIDQLVAYKSGRTDPSTRGVYPERSRMGSTQDDNAAEVQLSDVQLFLDEKIDDNTFALTDAIVAGNHKLAFKLLNGQRALGAEDAQIFGAILWQFRVLMSMRDLYERCDMRSDEMAKVLKMHPFVVKKNLAIVKKYSTEKLKKIYA